MHSSYEIQMVTLLLRVVYYVADLHIKHMENNMALTTTLKEELLVDNLDIAALKLVSEDHYSCSM